MKETEAFKALASADRQLLLYELVRTDGQATETELARRVAAWRHHISPEKIGEEETKRAHLRLVHTHLPLLLDLGIIKRNQGKVVLTDEEQRDQLLDAAEDLEALPPNDRLQHPPV